MASWRASSKVRSWPVTFARMVDRGRASEQVEHGQVRGGLPVRHGRALEHLPALRVVGVEILIDEAGLPHPGLTDHGHHLSMSRPSSLQGLHQGGKLRVAADKA